MSRLDFAPKLKEIEITDIKSGTGAFAPKPERAVSFAALRTALKRAGYTLASADIVATGTLSRDASGWWLIADASQQRFALAGADADLERKLEGARPGMRARVTGDWRTVGEKGATRELITPREVRRAEDAPKATGSSDAPALGGPIVRYERASHVAPLAAPHTVGALRGLTKPLAPIRTTSPGLTVYKGGAFTPRLYLVSQHLGELDVRRQLLDLSLSYTPTPRTQLEVEVPFSRAAFDDGATDGSASGLGNLILWSKYRFFRTVKPYGDRQAAARFGLELPTGKKSAPGESEIDASAFVRQQLTPISGGLATHFDASFSQAGGRLIFGGNIEAVLRSARDGFRLGHELRVNTDTEYVLLPREYRAPGRELFAILETTFIQRGLGRLESLSVPGSKSTEFYLSPGLQYAAAPRFVLEGSVQLPLIRNTGEQVLRTSSNILLGVRYLF